MKFVENTTKKVKFAPNKRQLLSISHKCGLISAMEHFGFWGLIPPLLVIILAFVTKDVIISLFLGIFVGSLFVAGGNPLMAIINLTDAIAGNLADGWNIRILLFCALLGGLVGLMTKTGASRAFGEWAVRKIKKRSTSMLMAWVCGVIIFIDDYFNSLAVGTIMRPITDKNKISRAKLAWILDSTAAPVCILAPISSWVVTVMSIIRDSSGFESLGMTPLSFFIHLMPYNIYAILTLIMIIVIAISGRDYAAMARAEAMAKEGVLYDSSYGDAPMTMEDTDAERRVRPMNMKEASQANKAKTIDMILPLLVLIVVSVVMFPFTTYLGAVSSGDAESLTAAISSMTISDAFNNTDASMAMFYAIIFTLIFTYIYYLARRLFNIKESSTALLDGMKTMAPALVILTLAWTIGGIIKSSPSDGGLGLSVYLSEVFVNGNFPLSILPVLVFILSALIAFATGTSWGTFAIMIPITLPIAVGLAGQKGLEANGFVNACSICIGAVLGGAVFGDHASPISDTTILSSTGAGCPHLQHVATQLPDAGTVAVISCISLLISGLCSYSLIVGWVVAIILFVLSMIFLPIYWKDKKPLA